MRASRLVSLGLIALAVSWPGFLRGQTLNQRMNTLDVEIETLAQQLSLLRDAVLSEQLGIETFSVETRLADGRLMFLLEDYIRAAIVFLDIVERRSEATPIVYREARYYLAESLFRAHNLLGARGYFEGIGEDRDDPFRVEAFQRLLEIAFETGDESAVPGLSRALVDAGGRAQPAALYVLAKAYYLQQDYGAASAEFGRVPPEATDYVRSQYFKGIAHVRMGEWEDAIRAFEAAREGAPDSLYVEADAVGNLARLGLGRIYYELEQYHAAAAAYQSVSRTSTQYDRALFELCWAYMALEQWTDALRTLELMLLAMPESDLAPEARLLEADLLMRNDAYADAEVIFSATVEEYAPLADQLTALTDSRADPQLYLAVIRGEESLALPAIAEAWVRSDALLADALATLEVVEDETMEIQEAQRIGEDILAVLGSSSRVDLFPEMRQGYGQALELGFGMMRASAAFAELEAEIVCGRLETVEAEAYRTARAARVSAMEALEALPSTFAELEAAESAVEAEIEALELEAYRLGFEIETQRAQLAALDQMAFEARRTGVRTAEELELLESEVALFENTLTALANERARLRRAFERARLQTGLGAVEGGDFQSLGADVWRAVRQERNVLARARVDLPESIANDLADLDRIWRRLAGTVDLLDRFFSEVNRSVSIEADDIRRAVEVELVRLDDYERILTQYGSEGERLAGEIAFQNFLEVQETFHIIVLRADVGIIDIAWREKEERSIRIDLLFEQRDQQLDILDAEFRELLESGP